MTVSELINPATEKMQRPVEQTSLEETNDAVARAKAAQRDWARLAPGDNRAALRAFAAAVDAHAHELAALETRIGDPIGKPVGGGPRSRRPAVYAATPERLSGEQIPVAGGLDVTFNEPLGVSA